MAFESINADLVSLSSAVTNLVDFYCCYMKAERRETEV